jgi:signal transduction histidine kinase
LNILGSEIDRRVESTPDSRRIPFILKWARILEVPISAATEARVSGRHAAAINKITEWHHFVRQYQYGKTSAEISYYHGFFATAIAQARREGSTNTLILTEPSLCASIYWRHLQETARAREEFIKWCAEQEIKMRRQREQEQEKREQEKQQEKEREQERLRAEEPERKARMAQEKSDTSEAARLAAHLNRNPRRRGRGEISKLKF